MDPLKRMAMAAAAFCSLAASAQVPPPIPCPPNQFANKTPVPYVNIREADVMWSKRIWRTIDLREKMNLPLYYPLEEDICSNSLWEVIKRAVLSGKITAYGKPAFDDEFQNPLTPEEAARIISSQDTILSPNPATGLQDTVIVKTQVAPENIKRYWLKEDWYFDKQRSVLECRIIGLCPLVEKIDKNTGDFRGYSPLFWLYYSECRPIFAKEQVLWWMANTAARPSLDDIFQKRLFSSFIHKESNVYNRAIVEYTQGMDALLEADRIKEEIFNFEQDLWHY